MPPPASKLDPATLAGSTLEDAIGDRCAYCEKRQGVDVDHEGRRVCRDKGCRRRASEAARKVAR